MITLIDICFLQFGLSHSLDRGEPTLSLADLKEGLKTDNLFEWLKVKGFTGDLSMFTGGDGYGERGREMTALLLEEDGAFDGRERRKLGIEKNGIAYLMSLTIELVQSLKWSDDRLPAPVKH